VVHPDEVEEARGHTDLAGGARETFLQRFVRKDSTIVEGKVTLTVAPDNEFRIAVIEDITDRLRLERQLADAHKLEAVGRLAGGIAHDFNNLLTAVSGHAELIRYASERTETKERTEIEESVDVILDASGRGADLTRQLLTFSRQHKFSPQRIDTPELLHRTEKLLRRVLGSFIRLETQIDPATPPIFADPSQMDQVLLNLALNARDAMLDGGTLTLTLTGWARAARDPARYAAVPVGEYCRLTVRDTGVGMDSTTLERIFEPFFTTKDVGKGTGLGLATCYGIVTNAGGHLFVSSEPNKGTEFEIILPAAAADDGAQSAPGTASHEVPSVRPRLQVA
jgi:two-component system cell cycle sensor histidine kinase/response regulator CckA